MYARTPMAGFITICGMGPIFLFGIGVVVVIAIAIAGHAREKRRTDELIAWVTQHGLYFDPSRDSSFDERFTEFDCLRRGSDRYAYNIITGQWDGRDLIAFDYHYETHSTDSKGKRQTHHHHFSAVMLTANIPLKPLVIRSENLFDKLAGVFGFDDIDFESAEFSRRFCVKSPDRRWAYDVLHQRAMQFLLDSPRFSIEFDRTRVIAWRSGRFTIGDRVAALGVIDGLLDQLPDYVRQQQQET